MTTLNLTGFGQDFYKTETSTADSWYAYGYALLTIAGADGAVSDAEMRWMMSHFRDAGAPDDVLQAWADFDYETGDLDTLIAEISFGETRHHTRILLYDAIRMATADGITGGERAAIDRAAELLNIDMTTVTMITSLAEMETTTASMRRALFTTD